MIDKIVSIINEGLASDGSFGEYSTRCERYINSLNAKQAKKLLSQIEKYIHDSTHECSKNDARLIEYLNTTLSFLWLKLGVELGADLLERENGSVKLGGR